MLQLVTEPTEDPLDISRVREHLRITGIDENEYLYALIRSATQQVQNWTGRQVMPATWDLFLDEFPAGEIEAPRLPLQEVTELVYTDPNGDEQSFADYDVDTVRGRVFPAYGEHWPSERKAPNSVRVRFVAGYENVPAPIESAILLLIGDLYENREAWSTERLHENKAVTRLLNPYRTFR